MKKIIGILLVFMMAFTIITINPFKVKAASTTTSAQVKDLISGNSLTAGSSGTNNNIKLTAGSELDKGGTNQWTSYTISTDVSGALITKVSIQGTEMVSTTGWTYTSGAAVWEDVNGATSVSGPSMKVTGNSLISVTYVSGKANISAPTTITKTYDGSALVGTATSTTSGASISYQTKTSTTGEYSTASESTPSITYVGTLYVKATVSAEGYANDSVEYALTINKITTPIIITVDKNSKTYDGTKLDSSCTYTQGVLLTGDELEIELSTTNITDAGKETVSVSSFEVWRSGTKVTNCYTFGTSVSGYVEVTKRSVIITSTDESKTYDGTALTGDYSITGDGFVLGEAEVSVTGSQTNYGSSKNTISITGKGNYDEDNYDITTDEGTLTVTKRSVIISSSDESKTYDGTALTGDYSITGDGFVSGEVDVSVTGSQTNFGSSKNTISITGKGNYDEDNYDITTDEGTLTVTKRSVTITSSDESKTYDGAALTGDYSITGDGFVSGEADVSVTGSQTNVGSSKNTISITGKGNYDEDNYDITTDEGTLTVTKRSVTITSTDESKTYDGTALTGDYSITGDGFVSGEADVSVTGSQTNFGSSKNTISITGKGNYDEDNYDITTDEGTLTVNKRYVTLIAPTQYKVFDGKELTNKNYTMVGSFAKGEGADVNIEGAITMVGEVDNVLTYQLHENTDPNNYVITTINGTLGVEYDQVQVQIKLGGNMLSDIIHQVAQYLDKESNNVILTGVSYDAGAGEYVPVENIPLIKFIPGMNGDAFGITINFQFTYSDGTVSYVRARLQFIY